jgi:hypothetical protein
MEKKKTAKKADEGGVTTVMDRPQRAKREKSRDATGLVRETAYLLYEKRGYAHGLDRQDWFEAEKIVYNGKKAVK